MSIINSFPHAICMQSVVVLVQRSCRTEQSVDILRIEQKLASQINKYKSFHQKINIATKPETK